MGGHIQKELQTMSSVILQSEKWSDPRKVIACLQLLIVSVGTEFVQFHLCPEASYSLLKNKFVEKIQLYHVCWKKTKKLSAIILFCCCCCFQEQLS